MDFVALDIETANTDGESICEIGLVKFQRGIEVDSWSSTIRPKSSPELLPINFSLHGISEEEILAAPYLQELWGEISNFVAGLPIVAHGATQDISKLLKAAQSDIESAWEFPSDAYSCSLVLARRSSSINPVNFSLRSIAQELEIESPDIERNGMRVHSAESDARACGLIAVSLARTSGIESLEELSKSMDVHMGTISNKEISRRAVSKSESSFWQKVTPSGEDYELLKIEVRKDGWAFFDHPLEDKSFLLTLGMTSLSESEYVLACALVGADVKTGVSSKLDYLIEGYDTSGKYEHGKTGKSKKARELIKDKGAPISIIGETEFLALLGEQVVAAVKEISGVREKVKRSSGLGITSQELEKRDERYEKTQKKKAMAVAQLEKFLEDPEWIFRTLTAGHVVGFTQLDYEDEETLSKQCWNLGMTVTKTVSNSLDLLVIDDRRFRDSAKLRDALQKGIDVTLLSHFIESNPEIAKNLKTKKSTGWRSFFS
jgi:DNA polymerase-3 subunit epsilon